MFAKFSILIIVVITLASQVLGAPFDSQVSRRAVANNAGGAPFFGIPTAFDQSQITIAQLENLYTQLLQVSANAEKLAKSALANAKSKGFATVTGEGKSAESVSKIPTKATDIITFGNTADFKTYFNNVFVVIRREDQFVSAGNAAKSQAEKSDITLRLFINKVMKLAGFLNQNVITLATKLSANSKADVTKQLADQKDGLTKINATIKELLKLQALAKKA
ncbi:hypothetical protein HK096_003984 [Nowakowskiella sp. JEL0078]|nr:hypothetical protein HK096_003984 [Nowakowskiella sp. JEL0078]